MVNVPIPNEPISVRAERARQENRERLEKQSQSETVTKRRVLVDVKIVIDPPNLGYIGNALSDYARAAERWAKEFEAFVRDHRSQDPVSISIEREYQQQCSKCGAEWEEEFYEDDGLHHCAGCGRVIEVAR